MKVYSIKELNKMSIKESIDCEANRPIVDYVEDAMAEKRKALRLSQLNLKECDNTWVDGKGEMDCHLCDLSPTHCENILRFNCEDGHYYKGIK